jgi:hypothetical protein
MDWSPVNAAATRWTSGFSLRVTVWQFMQVCTAGTPAWRDRSAPVWQYKQGTWLSPACSRCEKAMGCLGE